MIANVVNANDIPELMLHFWCKRHVKEMTSHVVVIREVLCTCKIMDRSSSRSTLPGATYEILKQRPLH